MGLLGIFDIMAVNGRMVWNMSVDNDLCTHKRFKLNNWKFSLMLAEEMIQFKDEHAVDHITQAALNISADDNNHSPTMIRSNLRVKCCVCSVEHMIQSLVKKSEGGPKQFEEMCRPRTNAHLACKFSDSIEDRNWFQRSSTIDDPISGWRAARI